MLHPILLVICWICFGTSCAKIARKKNRAPSTWFVLGLFFGFLALATIYFLKPKRSAQKNITINPYLDTKTLNQESIFQKDNNYWYFLDSAHKQIGPMSLRSLFDNYFKGKISKTTFIWNDTMKNWTRLNELSSLLTLLKDVTN